MLSLRAITPLLLCLFLPCALRGHEAFLPLHHDSGAHEHGEFRHPVEVEPEPGGKESQPHISPALTELRFALATGARFTRYSVEGEEAHLWETGVGLDYAVFPWLHIGGDASYGWFDSDEGSAEGWLTPTAHLDFHLPLRGAWEVVTGVEVGFPGGEEALVGDHWEWAPHLELRYDPGLWFAEAGASLVFVSEQAQHDHEHHAEDQADDAEEHDHDADEHSAKVNSDEVVEESHSHAKDFHDIVNPHGERELQYFAAAGVRLLDRRLTLESRVSGIHVLRGDTPDDNYLRAGLRASLALHERVTVTTDGSVPITGAERNEWEASVGLRVGF